MRRPIHPHPKANSMLKVRGDLFALYADFQTIPLHRYDETRTVKGKTRQLGKAPIHKNWTTRHYRTDAVIKKCESDNRNMGARLRASDLVIDVDPRNGGDKGFADLCKDIGLDARLFPTVATGSGGLHLYGKKPADLPIVDTLKNYPGVEFKSKNRQVVAAGSIHPDEPHRYYLLREDRPKLKKDLPEFPKKLLRLIARPQHSILKGGGQFTLEQLAAALDQLEPENFREHSLWLEFMMACHHATNGDGRDIFVEWSTRDPQYADDGEVIGRRWDSLSTEGTDPKVTYKTLNLRLAEVGANNYTVSPDDDARDDFAFEPTPDEYEEDEQFESPEDDEFEESDAAPGPYNEQERGWLEDLNRRYTAVLDGTKFRIVEKQWDGSVERWRWVRIAPQDFQALHANRRVKNPHVKDKNATQQLGTAWIEWPRRNTVSQIVFAPNKQVDDALNLWTGFAVQTDRNGEWSYLEEMLFEVICNGDQTHFDYLLNWSADMIQNPGKPAETAVVIRGGEGVGKGTWGNALAKLLGQHGMAIHSSEHLTGRFNSHLQDLVFLFADEAIKPYDKIGEAKLKAFITERMLTLEGKGRDAITCPNYLHILMASNEQWVVPAAMDARRFFVLEANRNWKGDQAKWDKLHTQLRQNGNSGYGALLQHLLTRDLEGFSAAHHMPRTAALTDQKLASLHPLQRFFFEALGAGQLPFEGTGSWETEAVWVWQSDFRDSYKLWCREAGVRYQNQERSSPYFLMRDTAELFPNAEVNKWRKIPEDRPELTKRHDKRAQAMLLPKLADARDAFNHAMGGTVDWSRFGIKQETWEE
jgi:hypothetical protein